MSTPVRSIAGQTLRQWWRDGRLPVTLLLLLALGALALLLSAQRAAESERDRVAAEATERATFEGQGARNPHSVAHFSRFAFRPLASTASLDPGIGAYAGVAVWLEAHWQDLAEVRAAEDRVELGRLADLSLAWLLQVLAPLLVIALGFDAVSGERERGTLPLLRASGTSLAQLVRGKALALGVVFGGGLLVLVLLQWFAARGSVPAGGDAVLRTLAWGAGHAVYLGIWIALVLAASLRFARPRVALVALLAGWTLAVLLVPRLATALADQAAPVPTPEAFSQTLARGLDEGIDGDEPYQQRMDAFKARVLEEYGVERVEDLPVNYGGLSLDESERYGDLIFDRHFGALSDTYRKQQGWRRVGALLSPLPVLQHLSMGTAGTDVVHHVDFVDQAETQRRAIVKMLNEDLIRHGVGHEGPYLADASLWARVPEFVYSPPRLAGVAPRIAWDGAILLAWLLLAAWLVARVSRREEAAR